MNFLKDNLENFVGKHTFPGQLYSYCLIKAQEYSPDVEPESLWDKDAHSLPMNFY
jgi:hypothetical protein